MSEQTGHIVFRPPNPILNKVKGIRTNNDLTDIFYDLAKICEFSESIVNQNEGEFDELQVVSNLVYINHEISFWSDFSRSITASATGLEYYAKHRDDYSFYLYSMNQSGARFELEYSIDDSIENVHFEIEQWNRELPKEIVDAFPFMQVSC